MTDFKKYSSLENLKKSSEILLEECVLTEKIHGTNVRFCWSDGGLWVGSRNNVIWQPKFGDKIPPQYDGYKFYDYIVKQPYYNICFHNPSAFKDFTFYGEWFGQGVQKGVQYTTEGKDLRIFDIRHPEGYFLDWDDVLEMCKQVKLKTVPEVFRGKIRSMDKLNEFLDVNSQTAIENGVEKEDNIAEGVVIKPLKEKLDRYGHRLIVKYKSAKWAETAQGPKKNKVYTEMTDEEVAVHSAARELADKVCTPGRVATIVEHITRDGNTELSMKRTGDFLKEFIKDVQEEFSEVYEKLDRRDANIYNKKINSQASLLWRQYLMEL